MLLLSLLILLSKERTVALVGFERRPCRSSGYSEMGRKVGQLEGSCAVAREMSEVVAWRMGVVVGEGGRRRRERRCDFRAAVWPG